MKLEFDSIDEVVSFLKNIGYTVYKGTTHYPQDNNPFYPQYPVQPITVCHNDPNLSSKIMCQSNEDIK